MRLRFDLDESLFPLDDALPGLLTAKQIIGLEEEWKAAKVDEWCTVTRLAAAASRLRRALVLPETAPFPFVLNEASLRSGDARVRRAMAAYEDAATAYEDVRVDLASLRNRATTHTA